jgi:hypothetical protein
LPEESSGFDVTLTERQWKNRIWQRRELAAKAAELEERICTALEAKNASLEEVRGWLSEADSEHSQLRVFGYSLEPRKALFADVDLLARLGKQSRGGNPINDRLPRTQRETPRTASPRRGTMRSAAR